MQAHDLDDIGGVFEYMGDIIPSHPAQFIIIDTDKGAVEIGVGLPIDDYDGDTAVVGFFHHGGERFGFVGGDEQDVDVLVEQLFDLPDLQFAVVIGAAVDELRAGV